MSFLGHAARRRVAGWLLLVALGVAGGPALHAQAEGTPKWPAPFRVQGFLHGSPALSADGRTLYLGTRVNTNPPRGVLYAIDASGSLKWQSAPLPDWIESSPAVAATGRIYVGCWDGKLYAFDDPGTTRDPMRPRWQYDTGSSIAVCSPAVARDGTVYIGGFDSALHAVSPNGTQVWRFAVSDEIDSSPAIGADGTIYFGSWDRNVYAVNPDGTEKWRVATGAEVLSSPAIGADGTIYVGSSDKKLYAIGPAGDVRWTYLTGGQVASSPVLGADGTVYFGSDDNIFYAVSPNGTFRWSGPSGKPIVAAAAVRGDGAVLYGSYDGVLRAFTSDGAVKWAFAPEATNRPPIEASPVVAPDGTIYHALSDGRLFALHGNGSPLSTYSNWPAFRRDAAHTGAMPAPSSGGRLLNLSTRAPAGGPDFLIAGMVVTGTAPKNFLFRGIGPTLAQFFVPNPLPDPVLEIYSGNAQIARRDDWGSEGDEAEVRQASAAVAAFALPSGSKDAALVANLVPGIYTAVIRSADSGAGVALVEAYDAAASSTSARLVNLSTRGRVTGGGSVIPGLFIGGSGTLRVLVRAIGPGLAGFGVEGVLARPTMTLFSEQTLLRSNTGWTIGGLRADLSAAMSAVGAFPLADGSADCAMLLTLPPGAYTIPVAGINNTAGEVLVEIYVVP